MFPLGLLWCHYLYLSLLSTLSLFLCMVQVGDQVLFFLHVAVQISQHHLLKRLFLLHFRLPPPYSILFVYRVLGYFWALYCIPLVYIPVWRPVPDYFDYSDLGIQFGIRHCDPFYFILPSQNYCGYSGSFMVPYKFLKCLLYISEICHWYFNRDCAESIHCFGQCGHFDDANSSNPLTWYLLSFLCVFLNFFLHCCVFF